MTDKNCSFPNNRKAFIICPDVWEPGHFFDASVRLEEALGLALAIQLDVLYSDVFRLREIRPSTFFGGGQVTLLKSLLAEKEADLLVVDGSLTPIQQRNLEKELGCKVIDRTALILEIFGARARTAEGQLQVELAALTYQRSRLVRSWTHLERQRGGLGFIGGPGETQLEMDRRMIGQRITKIKKRLEDVKRTRALHRRARKRVPYPVVALVGYTNAGKSTLFNRLTQARVFAEDLLFATLDPTMRLVQLPSRKQIILSDTVGFISDLPTSLIAAFRATLEEVLEADLIIHVRDIAHKESSQQKEDVLTVLKELGLEHVLETRMIEALNKIDLMDHRDEALDQSFGVLPISALTGQGIDGLLGRIDDFLRQEDRIVEVTIPMEEGSDLAWFYQHGHVISRSEDETGIHLKVHLSPQNWMRYTKRAREQQ